MSWVLRIDVVSFCRWNHYSEETSSSWYLFHVRTVHRDISSYFLPYVASANVAKCIGFNFIMKSAAIYLKILFVDSNALMLVTAIVVSSAFVCSSTVVAFLVVLKVRTNRLFSSHRRNAFIDQNRCNLLFTVFPKVLCVSLLFLLEIFWFATFAF